MAFWGAARGEGEEGGLGGVVVLGVLWDVGGGGGGVGIQAGYLVGCLLCFLGWWGRVGRERGEGRRGGAVGFGDRG